MNILFAFQISMCDKSRNTWLCVHWQRNTLEWCQLNALQASPVVHLVTPLSCVSLSMNTQPSVPAIIKATRVASLYMLYAQQAKPGVHFVDTTRVCFLVNKHTTKCSCFYLTCLFKMHKVYPWHMYTSVFMSKLGINSAVCIVWIDETWWNNRLLLVPQLLWSGHCGCNKWSLRLHHCDVTHWDKQSCVTMAAGL